MTPCPLLVKGGGVRFPPPHFVSSPQTDGLSTTKVGECLLRPFFWHRLPLKSWLPQWVPPRVSFPPMDAKTFGAGRAEASDKKNKSSRVVNPPCGGIFFLEKLLKRVIQKGFLTSFSPTFPCQPHSFLPVTVRAIRFNQTGAEWGVPGRRDSSEASLWKHVAAKRVRC